MVLHIFDAFLSKIIFVEFSNLVHFGLFLAVFPAKQTKTENRWPSQENARFFSLFFLQKWAANIYRLDFNDGQLLIAMRCRCYFYDNNAMSIFLAISYHRNRCDFFWSTISTDYFPMFFPI